MFAFLFLFGGCSEKDTGIRVGVSFSESAQSDPYLMERAIRENCSRYGARMIREKQGFADLLQQNLDVLILRKSRPQSLESAIKEAHHVGIPLVVLDYPPPSTLHVEGYIRVDNQKVGRMMAEYVVGRLAGKGNVIVLEGPAGNELSRQITLGIYNVLEKHSGIRIVADKKHKNWDAKLAEATVRSTIHKYAANIQAVLACDDRLIMGALRAIQADRLTDRIVTAAVGANLVACEAINSGIHDAEIDRMPYERGIEALSMAVAIAKDEPFQFDEEMGDEEPRIKVKLSPLRLITKENISEMKNVRF